MHLLMCPSCGRRYAVSGAGSLDEWQCTKCSQSLTVTSRDVSRLTVVGDVRPAWDALISPKAADLMAGASGTRRAQGAH